MARTLILGAGFGGIAAAVELRRLCGDDHEVVLVDRAGEFSMGLRKLWEAFDGQGGDPRQSRLSDALGIVAVGMARLFLDVRAAPDGMEGAVEAKSRIDVARKGLGGRDDRLQRGADEIVAVDLTAGQRAGVTAKKGKMGLQIVTERHSFRLLKQ